MARAEVLWEDQLGAWQGALAKMEDTSLSGACVRVPVPISVGAKLKVKWHREEFSGIAKYCRRDGGDYVLGIQRENLETEARTTVSLPPKTTSVSVTSRVDIQALPVHQENKVQGSPQSIPEVELAPITANTNSAPVATQTPSKFQYALAAPAPIAEDVPATGPKPELLPAAPKNLAVPLVAAEAARKVVVELEVDNKTKAVDHPVPRDSQVSGTVGRNELHAQDLPPAEERTIVFNKLLNRGPEQQLQQTRDGSSGNTKVQVNSADVKPIRDSHATTNARVTGVPPNQGSLPSLEDIYLAVGIVSSHLGYNIDTVSVMLDSNHLRGMSAEVKRASVLMALEAAGIPVDELLRDGAKRLDALNSYEAAERKRFEDYEARKTQESAQIQQEIEQMTAHCMDRIKHNLSEVTLAKDAFLNWQTTKQNESQRVSEAVALFSKPVAVEQTSDSKPSLQTVGADSKS